MLLSKGSAKLRSLGLSPFVLAVAGFAASATTGCFFIDEGDHHQYDDYDDYEDPGDEPPPVDEPKAPPQYSIAADQVLKAAPGEGVGVFVEYASEGKWRVWTTCDTFVSKEVCSFDIFASARPETLRTYATEDAEGFDEAKDLGNGTIEFLADTDSDTDGMVLELEPGAALTLEVYLDGLSAEAFFYWVSDGVVHAGAPANPVQFVPATP